MSAAPSLPQQLRPKTPQHRAYGVILDFLVLGSALHLREDELHEEILSLLGELHDLREAIVRFHGEQGHVSQAIRAYHAATEAGRAEQAREEELEGVTPGERAWDRFEALDEAEQAKQWAAVTPRGDQ